MILDTLDNAAAYDALNPGFAPAFAFLTNRRFDTMEPGRYEIDGERVYAVLTDSAGRNREDARLEAHNMHIDIQYVVTGAEEMGWKPRAACDRPRGVYDSAQDLCFFDDRPDLWLPVGAGAFAVFFPADAHAPMIARGRIRKVVVKVLVRSNP